MQGCAAGVCVEDRDNLTVETAIRELNSGFDSLHIFEGKMKTTFEMLMEVEKKRSDSRDDSRYKLVQMIRGASSSLD